MKSTSTATAPAAALLLAMVFGAGISAAARSAEEPVISGPQGAYPYLFKGSAARSSLAPATSDPSWSLLAGSRRSPGRTDTLHIIAFMVEFNSGRPDSSSATTGTGLFNIWGGSGGTAGDIEEMNRYAAVDTPYRYDRLDHYQRYFERQLQFTKTYFERVSSGAFTITYDVFPKTYGDAYHVSREMAYYSPGGKQRKESWDEYYFRKTKGLMQFVVEAVRAAHAQQGASGSPFDQVYLDDDANPVDSNGNPVGFLILHAGASYLTDGGRDGAFGANSPSDMIDAFISTDFFSYFRDELELERADSLSSEVGVRIRTADGDHVLNEIMMCSETSNQDGLNWGIHGILVNQIARQIGLPDLFSTSSGISGIGAFCIMDFAGYSAGQGFIPPWPSAWVRAFMGWDTPVVAAMGRNATYPLKAPNAPGRLPGDTTMLLIPINDHEYYLIENRQRNPQRREDVLRRDTTDGTPHLASYPYNLNLPANVTDSSGIDSGNVILDVYNYDVGIPASGVLIWHVDETVLRGRLASNLVNADSLYRGISLVEADGVNDLGIMFADMFYQAVFDWGGAEDVFPHSRVGANARTVDSLGPYTRPATRSKDGGQTRLGMRISRTESNAASELYRIRDYFVRNYTDTVFSISVSWDYLSPGWPRRVVPDSLFDPLPVDFAASEPGQELLLLSRSGLLYVLPATPDSLNRFNRRAAVIPVRELFGDTVRDAGGELIVDTAWYAADIGTPLAMPALIDSRVYIPTTTGVQVLHGIDTDGTLARDSIFLPAPASTHVCHTGADTWALGTAQGTLVLGSGAAVTAVTAALDSSAVTALCAVPGSPGAVACVQASGRVSLHHPALSTPPRQVVLQNGIAPYRIVSGDIDGRDDGRAEFIISDSRQGLWVLDHELTPATGWSLTPNDWASAYALTEDGIPQSRSRLPVNSSGPSLADINRDGRLDIIIGGTNGIYALNYKGVLIKEWPRYFDNRYWLQRGSVTATPVIAASSANTPLVLYSSPSGDKVTFTIVQVTDVSPDSTTVYYRNDDGSLDSIWGLSASLVDSIMRYNDGRIAPYVLPGGYVDAVTASAARPLREFVSLPGTGREALYDWPLSTGATAGTSPLVCDLDGDGMADLVAVSAAGWIYRWQFPDDILSYDASQWSMSGYNAGRSFAYLGAPGHNTGAVDTIGFYAYPNPAVAVEQVAFRYAFNNRARNVRIDIYTYTGHHVYSWKEPADRAAVNYPDWNEHIVSLRGLGPAVYRCRLGATIDGSNISRFWKLAVVK